MNDTFRISAIDIIPKLFLCSACRDRVKKNSAKFVQISELENEDYECDICGALGKLYFCAVEDKEVKA